MHWFPYSVRFPLFSQRKPVHVCAAIGILFHEKLRWSGAGATPLFPRFFLNRALEGRSWSGADAELEPAPVPNSETLLSASAHKGGICWVLSSVAI